MKSFKQTLLFGAFSLAALNSLAITQEGNNVAALQVNQAQQNSIEEMENTEVQVEHSSAMPFRFHWQAEKALLLVILADRDTQNQFMQRKGFSLQMISELEIFQSELQETQQDMEGLLLYRVNTPLKMQSNDALPEKQVMTLLAQQPLVLSEKNWSEFYRQLHDYSLAVWEERYDKK